MLILNTPYVIYYLKSINQITKYVLVVIVYIIDNITLESTHDMLTAVNVDMVNNFMTSH